MTGTSYRAVGLRASPTPISCRSFSPPFPSRAARAAGAPFPRHDAPVASAPSPSEQLGSRGFGGSQARRRAGRNAAGGRRNAGRDEAGSQDPGATISPSVTHASFGSLKSFVPPYKRRLQVISPVDIVLVFGAVECLVLTVFSVLAPISD